MFRYFYPASLGGTCFRVGLDASLGVKENGCDGSGKWKSFIILFHVPRSKLCVHGVHIERGNGTVHGRAVERFIPLVCFIMATTSNYIFVYLRGIESRGLRRERRQTLPVLPIRRTYNDCR